MGAKGQDSLPHSKCSCNCLFCMVKLSCYCLKHCCSESEDGTWPGCFLQQIHRSSFVCVDQARWQARKLTTHLRTANLIVWAIQATQGWANLLFRNQEFKMAARIGRKIHDHRLSLVLVEACWRPGTSLCGKGTKIVEQTVEACFHWVKLTRLSWHQNNPICLSCLSLVTGSSFAGDRRTDRPPMTVGASGDPSIEQIRR